MHEAFDFAYAIYIGDKHEIYKICPRVICVVLKKFHIPYFRRLSNFINEIKVIFCGRNIYKTRNSIVHEIEHLKWFERLISDKTKAFFMIDFENHPVGSAQLIDIHPVHKNAEITIRLFEEKNFGKQIGSQALSILCDYGFNNLNFHRLWLRVFHDNERAIRAYKKNGFNEEGMMKEAAFIQGVFKDIVIMGKIRND